MVGRVGKVITTGMSQHVKVNRKLNPCYTPCPFNKFIHCRACQWSTTLGNEYKRTMGVLAPQTS